MELVVQTILFFVTFWLLFRRDRFCSIYYAALFLYMLPVEVICGYYPFLLKEDFGSETYLPYYTFSTLSLLAFWIYVYINLNSKKVIRCITESKEYRCSGIGRIKLVYFIIFSLLAIQGVIIALSYNDISYQNLITVDYKKSRPLLVAGSTMFMISKYISLLLLFKYKTATGDERKKCLFLLIWALSQNFLYGTLAGSRSGLLAIMIAILFALYGHSKLSLKNIIKFGIISFVLLFSLQEVRNFRSGGSMESEMEEYAILQNDYAAPGQLTIAAIKYDTVDPVEVVLSNICRSVPFANYPYLYVTMTEIFMPGLVDEANAMGFYTFTEGYMFCGMLGFIYNAIVVGWLLLYWRRIGRTNNLLFNLFVLSLMVSCFFGMVRAQTVWFVRYLWLSIIPMTVLYSWFMGIKVDYKKLLLP